jgi:hypothetical protein
MSCHCSNYSLIFTKGTSSHSQCPVVRAKVAECCAELQIWQGLMREGKMPALPLFTAPLDGTHAIFICKVLLPRGKHEQLRQEHQGLGTYQHMAGVAARVYPHLLVHVTQCTENVSVPNHGFSIVRPPSAYCTCHTPVPGVCRRVLAFLRLGLGGMS